MQKISQVLTSINFKELSSVKRFAIIGGLATATHLLVGNLLIFAGYAALKANVMAFLVAFFVSFFGHFYYSFADHNQRVTTSLLRFALTALIGFSVNQSILWSFISIDFLIGNAALIASTTFSMVVTYFLSKLWAFRASDKRISG